MPTFRVINVPRPGVRLPIEAIEADGIVETPQHLVLTVDALVVGLPREIVALRVRRRDGTAVLRLCATSAGWGGGATPFGARNRNRPVLHQTQAT